MDQCVKTTRDFQQAESFANNTKTNELSACLWTNCYVSSATVFEDTSTGTITAIGRLTPSAHPGNEPIIVSLTIDTNDAGPISDTLAKRLAILPLSGAMEAKDWSSIWAGANSEITMR